MTSQHTTSVSIHLIITHSLTREKICFEILQFTNEYGTMPQNVRSVVEYPRIALHFVNCCNDLEHFVGNEFPVIRAHSKIYFYVRFFCITAQYSTIV